MAGRRMLRKLRILRLATLVAAAVGVAVLLTAPSIAAEPASPAGVRQYSTYTPDDMLVVQGFSVTITGAGSGSDVDSAWETVSGGSLNIEVANASVGTDQIDQTTPGHKYVDTLTLRGPLTSGRKAQKVRGKRGRNRDRSEQRNNRTRKFRAEIEGSPTASKNVESITVEDLVIDEREVTTGADEGYGAFTPGAVHFGAITIRSNVAGDDSELAAWLAAASEGKDADRDVSVVTLKRDGSESSRYMFGKCSPTRYSPLATEKYPGVAMEEITVRCKSVQIKTDGPRQYLFDWISDTVQGKDWKRTVVVKEITKDGSAGRTVKYIDAFPTRYVFPAFSASGTGNLYEEVAIKPIRLELE